MFRLVNFQLGKMRGVTRFRRRKGEENQTSLLDFALRSGRKPKKVDGGARWSLLKCLNSYRLSISFFVYLLVGSLFFDFNPGKGEGESPSGIDGYYQAITIGYSVGLAPRNPLYLPDPWFSTAYILAGATLIAIILNSLGTTVENNSSDYLFEDLKQRERYEKKLSKERPFYKRVKAFVKYNAGYLLTILLWILWLVFIIVWSIIATREGPDEQWSFAFAQYFAVSLCSSAGSFSLPDFSPEWAYGLAGLSMMVGVPLMALAISSMVIMCNQGDKFGQVKKAAWTPITEQELETLNRIGLGHGDEVISKGDFVLLGMLRMGTEAGLIKYLCDVYDTATEERGCVPVVNEKSAVYDEENSGFFSDQAKAYVANDEPDEGPGAANKKRFRSGAALFPGSTLVSDSHTSSKSPHKEDKGGRREQLRAQWSIFASKDDKSAMDLSSLRYDGADLPAGGTAESPEEMPDSGGVGNGDSD